MKIGLLNLAKMLTHPPEDSVCLERLLLFPPGGIVWTIGIERRFNSSQYVQQMLIYQSKGLTGSPIVGRG